jgi:pilus assembly protein CpaB
MAQVIAEKLPQGTNRFMLITAVLFAAIAGALVFVVLQSAGGGDGGSVAATAPVVVASRDVPANTRLTADMLDVRSLPVEAVVDGGYATTDALVGRATRFPLVKGEQLAPSKVALDAVEDEDDLARVLPTGKRGFAVEVTETTGVGGLLLPGNAVDVIAVFGGGIAGIDKAVTILQDIEVLSVAQEAQEPVPAVADASEDGATGEGAATAEAVYGRRPDDAELQPGARTVTLAVTPSEAQLLAIAQTNGTLWLSLRPFDDSETLWLDELSLLPYMSPEPGGGGMGPP